MKTITSSFVTYSAANSITSTGTYSNKTYTSSTADQNAVLVSLASGTVNLVNSTVTKSGDSEGGDNCNFYGINSGIMAMGEGTGNDLLWGDNGADTSIYKSSEGKDIIYGFNDIDMLKISGTFSAKYNETTKAVAFKVGSTASAITTKSAALSL